WPKEAAKAQAEAQQIELGGSRKEDDPARVKNLISKAIGKSKKWVLLGGPPCQAYSLVGRSRMGGINDDDPRVDLYKQYLWILANHQPSAFIFENVKGLASSKVKDREVFAEIVESLQNPAAHLEGHKKLKVPSNKKRVRYRLFGLETSNKSLTGDLFETDVLDLDSAIIRSEKHGVPQARHRIIILGIREELAPANADELKLDLTDPISIENVLKDLPRLRSGLSKETDGRDEWLAAVRGIKKVLPANGQMDGKLRKRINAILKNLENPRGGRGDEFVSSKKIGPSHEPKWYVDKALGGACNHATRSHLTSDLFRYLYAAVYAEVNGVSPKLEHFPEKLLPEHKNAKKAIKEGLFNDRFRVQTKGRPATTVTSHISKDGHYFIHPDPTQCRSLTVREAARIQTFPDNYFFCGPRTSQYVQVGNAVPPLLAMQIARIVWNLFKQKGIA
ncbi:DNA cytosine methyltransferase, partial [Verrucomicrobia bacterium]|nr:DNA cytosine methyltransferase [Verrucomicrobiota bacterium]